MGLMLDRCIDCLLVYDDPSELQGILTPRDFLKTILLYARVCMRNGVARNKLRLADFASGLSIDEVFQRGAATVEDVMSLELAVLSTNHKVEDAIKLIQVKEVRHIPWSTTLNVLSVSFLTETS